MSDIRTKVPSLPFWNGLTVIRIPIANCFTVTGLDKHVFK